MYNCMAKNTIISLSKSIFLTSPHKTNSVSFVTILYTQFDNKFRDTIIFNMAIKIFFSIFSFTLNHNKQFAYLARMFFSRKIQYFSIITTTHTLINFN